MLIAGCDIGSEAHYIRAIDVRGRVEYIEWKIPVKSETLHSGIIIDPDISYKEWLKSHTKYKKNVME